MHRFTLPRFSAGRPCHTSSGTLILQRFTAAVQSLGSSGGELRNIILMCLLHMTTTLQAFEHEVLFMDTPLLKMSLVKGFAQTPRILAMTGRWTSRTCKVSGRTGTLRMCCFGVPSVHSQTKAGLRATTNQTSCCLHPSAEESRAC